MWGRRWGEKENGRNPTDRGKPGLKDHVLTDGRGVPLSVVVTPANVNDDKRLQEVLDNLVVVRPLVSRQAPQHLALDAAFDNAAARGVVFANGYTGHIAPKAGRDPEAPLHPGGKARRWVVEQAHALHDRFRRLVVNWEKTIASRYAFLCLASALMAYRRWVCRHALRVDDLERQSTVYFAEPENFIVGVVGCKGFLDRLPFELVEYEQRLDLAPYNEL
jgi:transposase